MQASGGGPAGGAASSSWMASLSLDFLSAEELMGGPDLPFLDPATLLAVCGADIQQGSASGGSMPPAIGSAGMQQHHTGLKRQAPEDVGSGDDSDEDECRGGKTGSGGGKRGKGETSNAARVKASKEKARRGKINDRFAELAKLIEPGGSEPKTDKPSILADAIKYVQQLTIENHQLRQLNKFLEERVAGYERERGQNLYQQSLSMQGMMQPQQQGMMQQQQQGMMLPQQQGIVQPQQASMMQPQQGIMQPQGMQQSMMQPQPSMLPVQQQQLGGMLPPPQQQQGMVAGQGHGQGALQPMLGTQQQAAPAGMMPGQQPLMQTGMAHMPMQQTSTSGAMGSMHMQPQLMPGQQHQMGYQQQPQQQQQQMGYQQPQQQPMVYQQQPPHQQPQVQAQLKSEPSVDNSSQLSGSRQATSVEGESAPASASAHAAVSASPQPGAAPQHAQHAAMTQPGAPAQQQQQQVYGAVPASAPAPGYYYPSGLKPALAPTSGMPFGGMQAMHMGALPPPHWPNMGVDSAQQDSLLRPPVA